MRYGAIRTFETGEDKHRDRWLISYADLVTLLLALFIVLYAASDHERARRIAEGFSTVATGGNGILPAQNAEENDRARYEEALMADPVLMERAKMRKTKDGLVISLAEAGFFAPGEAVIDAQAGAIITKLAGELANNETKIRIEGHTDSTPIANAKYPSNWELSTARASSVLARFIESGIAPERLSAAGYAGFQPVADNATPEGRAQNRRVDIVVIGR